MTPKKDNTLDVAGQDGAVLSIIELGLGSLMYTLRVPMTGHILSLNQGFFLSRSLYKTGNRQVPVIISNIAAVLKSLAPSGKKLMPMLAISVQGFVYGFSTLVFGPNVLGASVGSALMSLVAFIQPLIKYYIIFGDQLFDVAKFFLKKLQESLQWMGHIEEQDILRVALWIIAIKFILAIILAIVARFLPETFFQRYQTQLLDRARSAARKRADRMLKNPAPPVTAVQKIKHAFLDLLNPLFLFSLFLTGMFFIYVDAPAAQTVAGLLRPIAIAFILFLVIRIFPIEGVLGRLEGGRFPGYAKSLRRAVETLKNL